MVVVVVVVLVIVRILIAVPVDSSGYMADFMGVKRGACSKCKHCHSNARDFHESILKLRMTQNDVALFVLLVFGCFWSLELRK